MTTPKTTQELVDELRNLRQALTWSIDKLLPHAELWAEPGMSGEMPEQIGAALRINGLSPDKADAAAEELVRRARNIGYELSILQKQGARIRSEAMQYEESLLAAVQAAKAAGPAGGVFRV